MSSSAAPYNITIDRGSDWSKVLTLSDNNGDPVAVTNIFTVAISITGTTSPSVAAASLTYVSADLWSSNGNATAPGSGTWIRVRRSAGAWEITRWVSGAQATGYWTSSSNPNHPAWVETWVAVAGATGSPVVDSAGMFFEGSISLQERGPDVIPFSFSTVGDGSAGQVEISLPRSYTRALANSGAYRFDWFVYHGRERIRLVAGRISAQGSSTGTSTGIPIPAFGSSPSGAWGNITGTLSNQTDLQAALSGKQPLDADLTAIAALTTTANGRALLTSPNALTIGEFASVSGTNTGDQDLSNLLSRRTTLEVNGTDPVISQSLVEQGYLLNGRRVWASGDGGTLLYDGTSWLLTQLDPDSFVLYEAFNTSGSYEPWKLTGWGFYEGSGQPSFTIDPPVLQPVNGASGTIALSTNQEGRVSPADMTGLGTGVATALGLAANAANGFPTANGAGRTALGSGATGDALFTAATPAAARETIGVIRRITTTDYTSSSTTLTAAPELTFPVDAGKTYQVDLALVVSSLAAVGGVQVAMSYPAISRTGLGFSQTQLSQTVKAPSLGASSVNLNTNTTGVPNGTTGLIGFVQIRPTASGNVTFAAGQFSAGTGTVGLIAGSVITVTEL